ncbi:sporulation initiation phosphotransferase F [Planococcus antarcticus DSM 14505]|uniref:Sporulation initiation phosphotransferase F n=1 Tax=Planococcus antarcticus DSM 14505 TaxID=1185653 RepID=A0A1C7DF08_9BACL|nr:response regulator [Planococcus antarcticus]ANU10034.1 two-component system response regulator [Planococcus antarcticus DSM 14505]EIM07381.1 sporulation initiation phosphotransferase F [Planococcus antarcticus DSM 14505]
MKTILIVDDQPGIRLLLKEVFSKEGYRAIAAGSGIEALEKVQEACPELVLLDMKIPGMDGIEILKRLKKSNPAIHVIMMTAYGELDLIKESMNWGAERYFTKPFDVFEVRDAVKQLLEE